MIIKTLTMNNKTLTEKSARLTLESAIPKNKSLTR